jgi:hypothetical protein
MDSMRNCDLLKKFHEEQSVLVGIVDKLVLDSVKKGSFHTSDMGGSSGDLSYRLVCTTYWVQLKIIGKDFVFEYSMDFEPDNWDCCQFLGDAESSAINFGKVQNTDKIWVEDRDRNKVLQYPIPEEQYFQNLTLFDLSSEDLYQYFVDIKKDHQCVLQLITEPGSDGINKFSTVLNDSTAMKKIQNDLKMGEFAIRRTAGL